MNADPLVIEIAGDNAFAHDAEFSAAIEMLGNYFGDDVADIIEAVRKRKTVLIEGGGPPMQPDHKLGRDALDKWRSLSERGLIVQEQI